MALCEHRLETVLPLGSPLTCCVLASFSQSWPVAWPLSFLLGQAHFMFSTLAALSKAEGQSLSQF